MIEQQARVVHANGGAVRVRVGGQSGCPACDQGRGCGAGVFGRLLRRKPVELELPGGTALREGQAVRIGMPETLFVKMVLRLYAWPLLAGLAGAAICHQIGVVYRIGAAMTDLLALAGLVAGGAVSLWAQRARSDWMPAHGAVRLLDSEPGQECPAAQTGLMGQSR